MSIAAIGYKKALKPTREQELAYAFPAIDPNHEAVGHKIVVQMRRPKLMHGSILAPEENIEMLHAKQQVGKVVSLGPVCFKNRTDLTPWPEGAWVKLGDYIRIPMYGANTWFLDGPEGPNDVQVKFALIQDHEILGKVPDPLALNKDML